MKKKTKGIVAAAALAIVSGVTAIAPHAKPCGPHDCCWRPPIVPVSGCMRKSTDGSVVDFGQLNVIRSEDAVGSMCVSVSGYKQNKSGVCVEETKVNSVVE